MQTTKQYTHIRWMIRRDMDEVLRIENLCFEFPWPEDEFIRCLRQRNCIGMVAERDERIVGYMLYELHKNRLHIINFAVLPSLHGEGIGRSMMDKLKNKLSPQRRNKITAEVRERNLEGQLFFKSMGFQAVAVFSDFYCDTSEDAYRFEFLCNEAI